MEDKGFRLVGSLAEATFDDESRTVKVTVIREGWSHNNFYYSVKPLESISTFLNTTAKQNFVDHNPKEKPFAPRRIQDWVSNVVRAWVDTDNGKKSVKAEVKLFSSGPNAWVYERMKEVPSSFGPSIVGKAAVRKGSIEGRSGAIVEDITYLHSFDFVAQPAAGGSIDRVCETIFIDEGSTYDEEGILGDKLKEKLRKRQTQEKLWDLEYTFNDLVRDLVNAGGDFEFDSVVDRKKALDDLMGELKLQVTKLKFAPPKKKEEKQLATEGDDEPMEKIKNLADLKSQDQHLYDSLVKEVVAEQTDQGNLAKLVEDSKSLEKVEAELKEAKDSASKEEQKRKEAEEELKKVTEAKDKLDAEAKVAKASAIAQRVMSEVGLTAEDCSDLFKAELEEIAFEDETTYEQKVKAKYEDRKALLAKKSPASVVKKMGGPSTEKKKVEEGSEFPVKSEDFAKELTLA